MRVGIFLSLFFLAANVCAQPLPSEEARNKQISQLIEITQANPKDVGSWHDLAGLYRDAQKWDQAIDAESHAIAGHPKYAVAYYGRGLSYFKKNDFPSARADFTKAIDLWQTPGGLERFLTLEQPAPEYIDSYRTRGLAWAHEGKYAEGIADLSTAMKLQKQDPKLQFERAYLEEKAGKLPDAIADYRQAGLLYMDRGSKTDAEDMAKNLDRLKADKEAADVRHAVDASKPKSDLP